MLKTISIENIFLSDSIDISFADGFVVITGETGSGKSMIMDSIGLLLGKKPRGKIVKDPNKKSFVRAVFDVRRNANILATLNDRCIDCDGDLLIQRVFSSDGTSKCYVCDVQCTVKFLIDLMETILEVNTQMNSIRSSNNLSYVAILDEYGSYKDLTDQVQTAYASVKEIDLQIDRIQSEHRASDIHLEILKQMVEDLESLDLKIGEEEELLRLSKDCKASRKITEEISILRELLFDNGIIKGIANSQRSISRLVTSDLSSGLQKDLNHINELLRQIDVAFHDLDESSNFLMDKISNESGMFDQIEVRLGNISNMSRKYSTLPAMLHEKLLLAKEELHFNSNFEQSLENLKKQRSVEFEKYQTVSKDLSAKRIATATKLQESVLLGMKDLALNDARFVVDISTDVNSVTAYGIDKVVLKVSFNKGVDLDAMDKVSSGGEYSRLMLILRSVVANNKGLQTIFFDEIDSGVSGAVSSMIGKKMSSIAKNTQVIAITHSHQVASHGNRHIKVFKETVSDSTNICVKELSFEERVYELAKMMGDGNVDEDGKDIARKMIASASR